VKTDRSGDFSDQHGQTLQEQLIEQLELAKLSPVDLAIARVITDAITDDAPQGRPRGGAPESSAGDRGHHRRRGTRSAAVQSLEPAGVGARNLGECIALQLRQLHPDTRRGTSPSGRARTPGFVAGPAARALAAPASLQRGRPRDGARAGAKLPSASGAAVNPSQAEYVIPTSS